MIIYLFQMSLQYYKALALFLCLLVFVLRCLMMVVMLSHNVTQQDILVLTTIMYFSQYMAIQ